MDLFDSVRGNLVYLIVETFENVNERSAAKDYGSVSFLSDVNKIFGKLVNNRLVDHFQIPSFIPNLQYGVKSQGFPSISKKFAHPCHLEKSPQ